MAGIPRRCALSTRRERAQVHVCGRRPRSGSDKDLQRMLYGRKAFPSADLYCCSAASAPVPQVFLRLSLDR